MRKICCKCAKEKDLMEFVKDKSKKDGTRNICKECENLRRRKTPIKPTAKDGFKYCASCNKELPIEDFNIRAISGKKQAYSYCKTCEREKDNNRYFHKCEMCGKEYRSGCKDNKICNDCRNIQNKGNAKYLIAYGKIPENNFWYGKPRFGKDNPNYNPEKTDEDREKGRCIEGYGIWRKSVYERDNYTCQCCGDKTGGNLKAHHKNGYHWYIEGRTDINNGVTLCEICHTKFHDTYGYNNNTEEQFEEFMKQFH